MATRPVFVPLSEAAHFVGERHFDFQWHPGFALAQKRRNIQALHDAVIVAGYGRILEVSTKSPDEIRRRLSAFNLNVTLEEGTAIPLECAFQGSKVFEDGGPFTELYSAEPRAAKRDPRLHGSGQLVEFSFEAQRMPITPPTAFYDWLYINALLRAGISLDTVICQRHWLERSPSTRRFRISEANIGPNRFHQKRTVSWQMSMPRSCSRSSTLRSDSGNRMYIITARRMISGLVLK